MITTNSAELKNILKVCDEKKVPFNITMLFRKHYEVEDIIDLCDELDKLKSSLTIIPLFPLREEIIKSNLILYLDGNMKFVGVT